MCGDQRQAMLVAPQAAQAASLQQQHRQAGEAGQVAVLLRPSQPGNRIQEREERC